MKVNDKLFVAVILLVILATAFLFFAGLHGKYRDAIAGKLHDDCIMYDIYRFTHSNNAAFAIREANRNN